MVFLRKFTLLLGLLSANLMVFAQEAESQDFFFRYGKYYVVAAVLVILFLFLFVYLKRMDKRVKKLERRA
jgi:CcmD family protein